MTIKNLDNVLPDTVGQMLDEGINIFFGKGFLKIGEIYRFKESFISVLLMVLRSHGVKLQPKEKVPMDCQVQLWGIIFNDLKENVIFYPRVEEEN